METIKLGTYSIHISPNIDTVMDISNKKLLLCHKSALNTIGLLTYNEQTDTIKFNCRWAIDFEMHEKEALCQIVLMKNFRKGLSN